MQKYTVVWRFCLAAFAAWILPVSLHATPTIETQTYQLQPSTTTTIQIFAHGGDAVQGLDLDVQTGDGGPFSMGTAGGAAPVITAVNGQPGTIAGAGTSIFTTSNSNAQGPLPGPPLYGGAASTGSPNPNVSQLWEISFTVKSGTVNIGTGDSVATHQLLATITIDTTGFNVGQTFPLIFINTNGGSTDFTNTGANGPNPAFPSTLVIVPEPSSFALLLLGAPLLLLRKRAATVA